MIELIHQKKNEYDWNEYREGIYYEEDIPAANEDCYLSASEAIDLARYYMNEIDQGEITKEEFVEICKIFYTDGGLDLDRLICRLEEFDKYGYVEYFFDDKY